MPTKKTAPKRLTRAEILAREGATESVNVPEWGGKFHVRELSPKDRATILANSLTADGRVQLDKLYGPLVVKSLHDPETGERVFEDADLDELMAGRHGAAVDTVGAAAMRVSRIGASAVEDAAGN